MKAAIFDPYLNTIGGGERYMLTVAKVLKNNGWEVDIEWEDPEILKILDTRLEIGLSGISVVKNIKAGDGYDLVFWLSDGSIPTLYAKKNILHFQTPFHKIEKNWILNKLKLSRISKIVCNSEFTKKFIDKEYGVKSDVVYPPVSTSKFKPTKKENIILSVGRFSQLQQSKRQDILVESFKALYKEGLNDWELVLVGGSDVGRGDYVDQLRSATWGFPIRILENLPFGEVVEFYDKAKIFWSASGFGVDDENNPEKVEHFGITVVEAMAAGCVPLVTAKGGYLEIIDNGKDGFLWNSQEELAELTKNLVKDERRRKEIAEKAERKSSNFSEGIFEKKILQLVG